MKHLHLVGWIGCLLFIVSSTFAQTDCPAIVQQALDVTDETCSETGRNQVCYGNAIMNVDFRLGYENTNFAPGDKLDLRGVAFMRLTPMDVASDIWGVALMKVQADVPDTLPGQNVTFLLFGDVEIENAVGRDDQPMQAFYFKTGFGDAPCAEAPESGILVQGPEGVTSVSFETNGARVTLLGETATVYMQSEPAGDDGEGTLNVSVIQGKVEIESSGNVVTAPAGAKVNVPLDTTFAASAPPLAPVAYTEEIVNPLPVSVLEEEVAIQPPLSEAAIEASTTSACIVRTETVGIAVHVGPGVNRSILMSLPIGQDIPVVGQQSADDGSLWWKLNISGEAETWVAQADVAAAGACNVPVVEAPPVITSIPPTATLIPTEIPIEPTVFVGGSGGTDSGGGSGSEGAPSGGPAFGVEMSCGNAPPPYARVFMWNYTSTVQYPAYTIYKDGAVHEQGTWGWGIAPNSSTWFGDLSPTDLHVWSFTVGTPALGYVSATENCL